VFNKDYQLSVQNYYTSNYNKKQIIIGDSFSFGMNHFFGWANRHNGVYKSTAPFSITRDGVIYEHYDPKHHSDFLNIKGVDEKSIPIVLENIGWLTKDFDNDMYITWFGDIYNGDNEIVEKKWRNYSYWLKYTKEQYESLELLCEYLIDRFDIPSNVIGHNTNVNGVDKIGGIVYKSNFSALYYGVNPTFEFERFVNNIHKKISKDD